MYRLGVLSPIFVRPPTGGPDSRRDTFLELTLQDLRDRGYIEPKSLMVEHRSAKGHVERLPELAAELVRLHVDVILAEAAPAIHAALTATTTIPIVMITGDDPVRSGFVASLGRPGGNITGVTIMARDLAVKRLEFLKMAVPGASRIAVLGNFASQTSAEQLGEVKTAAGSLRVQLLVVEARGASQLDGAFTAIAKERPEALLVFTDPVFYLYRQRIGDFARERHLPMISDWKETAEAGALIAYGPSFPSLAEQVATFIDRILKGTRPADLPVEQPTQFPLVVNMKVAKSLGLVIPPSLLTRADPVIE